MATHEDWVKAQDWANSSVVRAREAVRFTEGQLKIFTDKKMVYAAKKFYARLLRQKQHLAEAEAILAELDSKKI